MTHVKQTRHARLYTGRRQEALKPADRRCKKLVMGILDRRWQIVTGSRTGRAEDRPRKESDRWETQSQSEFFPTNHECYNRGLAKYCFISPSSKEQILLYVPSCKHVIPPIFVSFPLASNGRELVNRNVIRVTAFSTKWDCISFSFLCLPYPRIPRVAVPVQLRTPIYLARFHLSVETQHEKTNITLIAKTDSCHPGFLARLSLSLQKVEG